MSLYTNSIFHPARVLLLPEAAQTLLLHALITAEVPEDCVVRLAARSPAAGVPGPG